MPTAEPVVSLLCRICGNAEGNRTLSAREMMFGMRDAFEYIECSACGCVQIAHVPEDLGRYYPSDYYSYQAPHRQGGLERALQRMRADHLLGWPNLAGWLMTKRYGVPSALEYLRHAKINRSQSVLDIGSGSGELLLAMRSYGFKRLTGVDPFVAHDIDYKNGVHVWKRNIHVHNETHDFIMLHHTFEHMDEPLSVLTRIRALLNPGGMVLIRLPIASGDAFATYRSDWVQLDAPRHLFLHTPKSLALMAEQAGLSIVDTVFDSTSFQFWGSEQYRKNIPLRDPNSYRNGAAVFSAAEIQEWERKAANLNREGRGDQAAFYLRHKK